MKKNKFNIGLASIALLLIWIITWSFFGIYRGILATELATKDLIISAANTPASPVVVQSDYNEQNWELHVTLVNTGIMPIKILNKSLVLTPKWQQQVAIALNIPMNVTLNWGEAFVVKTKLNTNKDNFKLWDVLTSSFDYVYPISNDVYTLTHVFVKSNMVNKNNNVMNQNWDNYNLQNKYKEQTIKDYNNKNNQK